MGAWGHGAFENDDAMDWAWTLEDDADGSALRAILEPVALYAATWADPDAEASVALAAASVVAAARGTRVEELPEEANAWVARCGHLVSDELVALARIAVLRVLYAIDGEPGTEQWTADVRRLADQLGA